MKFLIFYYNFHFKIVPRKETEKEKEKNEYFCENIREYELINHFKRYL